MTKFPHYVSLMLLLVALLTWSSPAEAAPYRQSTVHVVQRGETLSGIAARYSVSVEAIRSANGIYNANQIYVGMTLTIPPSGSSSGSSSGYTYDSGYDAYSPQQATSASTYSGSTGSASSSGYASTPVPSRWAGSCSGTYTVGAGDTLSGIASRCGVSVSALANANGLSGWSFVYLGQRLVIPGTSTASTYGSTYGSTTSSQVEGTCSTYLTVRSGDTLSGIAARCGVSVEALKQWNSLTSYSVWVGQVLITTGSSGTYSTQTPTPRTPYATATPRWGSYATPTPTPHLEPTMRP